MLDHSAAYPSVMGEAATSLPLLPSFSGSLVYPEYSVDTGMDGCTE